MNDLLKTISEISVYSLIPIGFLFVCGVLLWAAGRRVMRTGFAATGLILGGIVGAAVGAAGNLGVEPLVAAVSGAVVFAVVAVLAYRLALAAALALLLAVFTPLGVWTADRQGILPFSSAQPPLATTEQAPSSGGSAPEATRPPDILDQILPPPGETSQEQETLATDAGTATSEPLNHSAPVGEVIEDTWRQVVEPFRVAWRSAAEALDKAPAPMRGSLLAAAAFGVMLGLVLGASAPNFTAVMVSALGGSFLLLSTGWIIGARLGWVHPDAGAGGETPFTRTPTFWAATWLVLAFVGLGIQWMFRPRRQAASDD